jgi:hypothetical protein
VYIVESLDRRPCCLIKSLLKPTIFNVNVPSSTNEGMKRYIDSLNSMLDLKMGGMNQKYFDNFTTNCGFSISKILRKHNEDVKKRSFAPSTLFDFKDYFLRGLECDFLKYLHWSVNKHASQCGVCAVQKYRPK